MNRRVLAIVISDNKILLMKRVKLDRVYYTFPGGRVEEGENEKHAIWRELKEELGVDTKVGKLLFEIDNQGRKESYFLIESWLGTPKLGGPEKERMSEENQYHLDWVQFLSIQDLNNLFPQEAVSKLLKIY